MTGKLPTENDENKDNERLKGNIPWVLKRTEKFEIKLKWIIKKHPEEATAILNRLDSYMKALNGCNEPQQVVAGWIHPEPCGVKALTEKGKGGSLRVTRLYLFPCKTVRLLYLLTIGDKNSQKDDIAYCKKYVGKLTDQ